MSPGPVPCAVDPGSVIEFKVLFCIQRSDRTRWPETFRCLNVSHSNRNAPSAAVVKFYLSLFPALFLPTLSHINHVYMHQFLHVETKLGQIVFFCFFFCQQDYKKKKQLDGGRVSSLCSSSNGSLSRSMLKSNFTAEINMLPASRWLQSFIQTMVSDGNRPQELLVLVCSRMKGWIQVRLRLVALTLFCFFFYSLNTQTCEIMSFIFAHG